MKAARIDPRSRFSRLKTARYASLKLHLVLRLEILNGVYINARQFGGVSHPRLLQTYLSKRL
jgi:hypothetical protein